MNAVTCFFNVISPPSCEGSVAALQKKTIYYRYLDLRCFPFGGPNLWIFHHRKRPANEASSEWSVPVSSVRFRPKETLTPAR